MDIPDSRLSGISITIFVLKLNWHIVLRCLPGCSFGFMLVLMASHEVKRRESDRIVTTRLPTRAVLALPHILWLVFVSLRDDMASLHVGNGGALLWAALASTVQWLMILKTGARCPTGGALLGGCCKSVGSWWCGLEHSLAWFKSLGRWLCAHFQTCACSCSLPFLLAGSPETLMCWDSFSLNFFCSISWHCRWAAFGNALQGWNLGHIRSGAYFFVSGSGLRIFRICPWSCSVLWFALFPLALLLWRRRHLATWSVHCWPWAFFVPFGLLSIYCAVEGFILFWNRDEIRASRAAMLTRIILIGTLALAPVLLARRGGSAQHRPNGIPQH